MYYGLYGDTMFIRKRELKREIRVRMYTRSWFESLALNIYEWIKSPVKRTEVYSCKQSKRSINYTRFEFSSSTNFSYSILTYNLNSSLILSEIDFTLRD